MRTLIIQPFEKEYACLNEIARLSMVMFGIQSYKILPNRKMYSNVFVQNYYVKQMFEKEQIVEEVQKRGFNFKLPNLNRFRRKVVNPDFLTDLGWEIRKNASILGISHYTAFDGHVRFKDQASVLGIHPYPNSTGIDFSGGYRQSRFDERIGCCEVSTYTLTLLKENFTALNYISMIVGTSLHEIGHSVGIEDCKNSACLMFCGDLVNVYLKRLFFPLELCDQHRGVKIG